MDINKDLIAASSTPMVLAILAEEDSYGYAILKRVREASGGKLEWTDGMLYPVLHRLERLGYVKARWEAADTGRRRKYYRITPQGRAQLAEERRQWQAVDTTLRGIWQSLLLPEPASDAAFARQASIWIRTQSQTAYWRLREALCAFLSRLNQSEPASGGAAFATPLPQGG